MIPLIIIGLYGIIVSDQWAMNFIIIGPLLTAASERNYQICGQKGYEYSLLFLLHFSSLHVFYVWYASAITWIKRYLQIYSSMTNHRTQDESLSHILKNFSSGYLFTTLPAATSRRTEIM